MADSADRVVLGRGLSQIRNAIAEERKEHTTFPASTRSEYFRNYSNNPHTGLRCMNSCMDISCTEVAASSSLFNPICT